MIGALSERLTGWLSPTDNAKTLRTEIRRLIASKPALERELTAAQERLHTAEGSLDLVAPAQAALEAAQTADATDRQRRMESGDPTADPKLSAAIAQAEAAVAEATRVQTAAEAALPTLKRKVAEAEEAVKSCAAQIDATIWQLAVSELASDAPAARQAAETLATFRHRAATLAEVGRRPGFFGGPRGVVPRELLGIGVQRDIVVSDRDGVALGRRLAAMRRNA